GGRLMEQGWGRACDRRRSVHSRSPPAGPQAGTPRVSPPVPGRSAGVRQGGAVHRQGTDATVDQWLHRSVERGALGRTVSRGISWTLLGSWLSTAVQIGTTMVLARLLTPADFGVMAMALTLTVVVNQFRNLGLSQA